MTKNVPEHPTTVLGRSWSFWEGLGLSGMFWDILGHSGTFWDVKDILKMILKIIKLFFKIFLDGRSLNVVLVNTSISKETLRWGSKNQTRQHVNIFDKQNEWLKSLKIKTNYGARQHVNIF